MSRTADYAPTGGTDPLNPANIRHTMQQYNVPDSPYPTSMADPLSQFIQSFFPAQVPRDYHDLIDEYGDPQMFAGPPLEGGAPLVGAETLDPNLDRGGGISIPLTPGWDASEVLSMGGLEGLIANAINTAPYGDLTGTHMTQEEAENTPMAPPPDMWGDVFDAASSFLGVPGDVTDVLRGDFNNPFVPDAFSDAPRGALLDIPGNPYEPDETISTLGSIAGLAPAPFGPAISFGADVLQSAANVAGGNAAYPAPAQTGTPDQATGQPRDVPAMFGFSEGVEDFIANNSILNAIAQVLGFNPEKVGEYITTKEDIASDTQFGVFPSGSLVDTYSPLNDFDTLTDDPNDPDLPAGAWPTTGSFLPMPGEYLANDAIVPSIHFSPPQGAEDPSFQGVTGYGAFDTDDPTDPWAGGVASLAEGLAPPLGAFTNPMFMAPPDATAPATQQPSSILPSISDIFTPSVGSLAPGQVGFSPGAYGDPLAGTDRSGDAGWFGHTIYGSHQGLHYGPEDAYNNPEISKWLSEQPGVQWTKTDKDPTDPLTSPPGGPPGGGPAGSSFPGGGYAGYGSGSDADPEGPGVGDPD